MALEETPKNLSEPEGALLPPGNDCKLVAGQAVAQDRQDDFTIRAGKGKHDLRSCGQ